MLSCCVFFQLLLEQQKNRHLICAQPPLQHYELFFLFIFVCNHYPYSLTIGGLHGRMSVCVIQVHHGVMPSHTMYALNMERILCRLWHPSHEELEQDRVHRQRVAAKDGVLVS